VCFSGGVYNGYYKLRYSSEKVAKKATASLKGSFGSGALAAAISGALSGNLEKNDENSRSLKSVETGFQATGWNAKKGPQVCAHYLSLLCPDEAHLRIENPCLPHAWKFTVVRCDVHNMK
jgi:hypothetical protein